MVVKIIGRCPRAMEEKHDLADLTPGTNARSFLLVAMYSDLNPFTLQVLLMRPPTPRTS